MQNHKTPDEICATLNALSHGKPPQDAWPTANWSYDEASHSYRSNAVVPGSLMEVLRKKPGFKNCGLCTASIDASAGQQMVLPENLANQIEADCLMQIPFGSAIFDYGPTGTASYLGSTLGGTAWRYSPEGAVYEGTFVSDAAAARVVEILGNHKIKAVGDASIVTIPDDQIIPLRGKKRLVQALCHNAGSQRCDWADFVERSQQGSPQNALS